MPRQTANVNKVSRAAAAAKDAQLAATNCRALVTANAQSWVHRVVVSAMMDSQEKIAASTLARLQMLFTTKSRPSVFARLGIFVVRGNR